MAVFSERAVFSLVIASCHFVAALLLTTVLGRLRRLSTVDWLIVLWLVYDVIVHVTLVSQLWSPAAVVNSLCLCCRRDHSYTFH